jgi:hypothetical protein
LGTSGKSGGGFSCVGSLGSGIVGPIGSGIESGSIGMLALQMKVAGVDVPRPDPP